MSKDDRLEFLEDERKKLWQRVTYLERLVGKKTSEYEEAAKSSAEQIDTLYKDVKTKNEEITHTEKAFRVTSEQLALNFGRFQATFSEISTAAAVSTENSKRITQVLSTILSEAETSKALMTEMQKLAEGKPILDEKIVRLQEIFKRGDDYDSKLNSLHKSISERKKEIDELYYQIIGYSEKNEDGSEIDVVGLKGELEASYNLVKGKIAESEREIAQIKEETIKFYNTFSIEKNETFAKLVNLWKEEYGKVLRNIEELLPNALTTGLSYAYSEKKSTEELENAQHRKSFNYAIFGLVLVSLIPFFISLFSLFQGDSLETVILRIPRIVLAILPLYLPILWVAYSANRKMNLAKRLIEEYSHKEVLSKTFEGLSKQIAAIDDKDISSDLRVRLLYNILEVNSENPGKLISDYNKSDHPIMDALDKSVKLSNAVKRLAKIPGFSKLAATLERKSSEILRKETENANSGLEMISTIDESRKQ